MGFANLFSPKQLLNHFSGSSAGWESVRDHVHDIELDQERLAEELLADRDQYPVMLAELDNQALLSLLGGALYDLRSAQNTVSLPLLVGQMENALRKMAENHALGLLEDAYHG